MRPRPKDRYIETPSQNVKVCNTSFLNLVILIRCRDLWLSPRPGSADNSPSFGSDNSPSFPRKDGDAWGGGGTAAQGSLQCMREGWGLRLRSVEDRVKGRPEGQYSAGALAPQATDPAGPPATTEKTQSRVRRKPGAPLGMTPAPKDCESLL